MIRISWFLVSSLHSLYTLKSIFLYFYTILPDSRAPSVKRLAGRVINLVVETDQLISRCEISHFTPVRKSEPTVQVSCRGVAATDAARVNSCNLKRRYCTSVVVTEVILCFCQRVVGLYFLRIVAVELYFCGESSWNFPFDPFLSRPTCYTHSYTSSLTCTFHSIQLQYRARSDLTETKYNLIIHTLLLFNRSTIIKPHAPGISTNLPGGISITNMSHIWLATDSALKFCRTDWSPRDLGRFGLFLARLCNRSGESYIKSKHNGPCKLK